MPGGDLSDTRWHTASRYAAMVGNMLFLVWILYNGIDEGFKGTRVEVLSYVALMVLLLFNTILLAGCRRKST
jgi:hypothetical protein